MTDHQIEVNGRSLAVEVDGDGPPMVFIHGIGGTSNVFQAQVDFLARSLTCVRVDLAGAGRSATATDITVDSHAADVFDVCSTLGVERPVIVGHSMGTLVGRRIVDQRPGWVAGLTLIGAVPPPADPAPVLNRARAIRTGGPAAVVADILGVSLSPATREDHPELAGFVRELIMRQSPDGYASNNEALASARPPEPIDRAMPLRLITGQDDKLSPVTFNEQLAREHGSAELTVLPRCGHWAPIENARDTTMALASFVSGMGPY